MRPIAPAMSAPMSFDASLPLAMALSVEVVTLGSKELLRFSPVVATPVRVTLSMLAAPSLPVPVAPVSLSMPSVASLSTPAGWAATGGLALGFAAMATASIGRRMIAAIFASFASFMFSSGSTNAAVTLPPSQVPVTPFAPLVSVSLQPSSPAAHMNLTPPTGSDVAPAAMFTTSPAEPAAATAFSMPVVCGRLSTVPVVGAGGVGGRSAASTAAAASAGRLGAGAAAAAAAARKGQGRCGERRKGQSLHGSHGTFLLSEPGRRAPAGL